MKSAKKFAVAAGLLVTTSVAHADELRPGSSQSVFGGAGYFQQWNRFSATGVKIGLGYDRLLGSAPVSLGGRAGLLVGDATSPYFGLRGLFWTPASSEAAPRFKIGGGADLWVNTGDAVSSPVFLYLGAETGLQFRISGPWLIDVPVEIGVLPYFSPKVFAFHLGVQVGRTF